MKKLKIPLTLPILLMVVVQLMSCAANRTGKLIKTKDMFGWYDLDSLSQSRFMRNPAYLKSISLNKGGKLYYQIPYMGHEAAPVSADGKPIVYMAIGSWRRNSDTLFLTFGSGANGDREQTCLLRSDSIISIMSSDRKIWTKKKKAVKY